MICSFFRRTRLRKRDEGKGDEKGRLDDQDKNCNDEDECVTISDDEDGGL